MSKELKPEYGTRDDLLIASSHFLVDEPSSGSFVTPYPEIMRRLQELEKPCRDFIRGPAMAILHYGTHKDKRGIEVAFPVSAAIGDRRFRTRNLSGGEVLSVLHRGSHEAMDDRVMQVVLPELRRTGVRVMTEYVRIFHEIHEKSPNMNLTEYQYRDYGWERGIARNAEQVLGRQKCREIMQGVEHLSMATPIDERVRWMSEVVRRVVERADEDQAYWVLSGGSYPFPSNRIADLRGVYLQKRDVDQVLEAMQEDHFWYEDTHREGNIIHTTKLPGYPQAHAAAATPEEKRIYTCHNATVQNFFGQIPPEFCLCSTGWYRQLWSGVFGKPVKVDLLTAAAWGDDVCSFAIHIPD